MGRSRSRSRIQRIVDERQQYRRDRNFDKADRLRDELRDMGVQVDDTGSSWTGPGGLEGKFGGGGFGGGGGGGGGRVDVDRIQRLVDERQSYRRDRDFNTADRLRDELRDMGVQVSDDSLTWRGPPGMDGVVNNGGGRGGGGGGGGRGRSRSGSRGRGGGCGGPPGGAYGMPGFGMPPPGYGGPQPGFGMPPPGYGGFGMPPGGGFGMPPPGYGGPPPLPPGWEQVADPASGRPYFCNRSTGETSWTPPPAPAGGPGGPGGYGGGPGPGGPPPLPQGWEQAPDPASGKPYYFNRASGETRWEPP